MKCKTILAGCYFELFKLQFTYPIAVNKTG